MQRIALSVLLCLLAPLATASHHSWRLSEVFSNTDGSLQFIEMTSSVNGHEKLTCCQMVAGNKLTGVDTTYRFPQNLASTQTANRSLLIATSAFEATYGIKPDYIIPDGYLATGPGDVFYNDTLSWGELPLDGVNALRTGGTIAVATPTNFSGEQITLQASSDTEDPRLQNLPEEAVILDSNIEIANTDDRILAIQAAISCTDNTDTDPSITFDLPLVLPVDSTTNMSVLCTDASGNEASAAIPIEVVSFIDTDNDGIANEIDDDDDGDGRPDVNDAFPLDPNETTDSDGDGIGNNADDDDNGNGIPDDEETPDGTDTDGDGIDDAIDTDDDNDTIPDEVELANGLDPLSASDAQEDNDGDGLSNADEFALGKDINRDDVAPVITLTSPLALDATGRLTSVTLTGVTAVDTLDGEVIVTADRTGPFTSGNQVIQWQATDAAGNTATREQLLAIKPLIGIQADQRVAEGDQVRVSFKLSGPPPSYPITVTYKAFGEATDDDFSPLTTTKVVPSGLSFDIVFNTLADDITEGDEHYYITLISADQAAISERDTHTLVIVEDNIAPNVSLETRQDSEVRSIVSKAGGPVTVSARASDPNLDDVLTYDWSQSDSDLGVNASTTDTVTIDSSTLMPGLYRVVVIVRDNAAAQGETIRRQTIIVRDSLPPLGANQDTDGDGVNDATEGYADDDANGIPAYLDTSADPSLLAIGTGQRQLETTAGLQLSLGEAARNSDLSDPVIDANSLANWAAALTDAADTTELVFEPHSDVLDFEIAGITDAGASVTVVLPLASALPGDAVYRKYSQNNGWQTYTEDVGNAIASAGTDGSLCPPPGSSEYTAGLLEGAFCVQLTIADGGLNDHDGLANQRILDPGVIATRDSTPPSGTPPAAITIEALEDVPGSNTEIQAFLESASCTDALSGDRPVTNDSPETYPWKQTTTVTFACEDAAGNAASFASSVTVAEIIDAAQTSGSSSGSGCFIATAAYGSWLAPEVTLLRHFRDTHLLTNAPGTLFVETYYEYSPPIADIIAEQPLLAVLTRAGLAPLIYSIKHPTVAPICLILLLLGFRYFSQRRAQKKINL